MVQLSDNFMANDQAAGQDTGYPMPFTRIEIAVMTVLDGRLHVLLARRALPPHAGKWALPGGVLRIDLDRSLDTAALRVMRERLGIELPFLRQMCALGGPSRDPRAKWALSVVFRALVPADGVHPAPGKRVESIAWRPIDDAIEDKMLAFDHAVLIKQAVVTTRAEIDSLELPFGFLPEQFTLGELQTTCEEILGHPLDKSSFRRRLADREIVEAVQGAMRGGAFRPAQLYRRRI